MFITKKSIPRRTVLRGMGATVALPFLDAMVPAGRALAKTGAAAVDGPKRLVCIEIVHGAAGSNKYGATKNLWAPAATGSDFDLSPTSLSPLEAWRNNLTIISDTDCQQAEAYETKEIGGDHYRSSAVFLTQAHPKQTEGSDVVCGTSMDQLHAQRFGQETPIPSMQLCIENVDQAGGCDYGYACIYSDTISWAAPTEPLPMIRDPRAVFDRLFGAGGTPEQRAARRASRRSILDWIAEEVSHIRSQFGAGDRRRLDRYLTNIREIERRIQLTEERNTSGELRALPAAPAGVPDSFTDHVELMFDLQAMAFAADLTRVFSLKLGRDASARVFPESGVAEPFHRTSHHGDVEANVEKFARINRYHVGRLPYLLDRLSNTMDGESPLLDNTMIMYGSPMGDPNLHNHRRCPLIVLGGANTQPHGNLHVRAEPGTPMANVMLNMLHTLGHDDLQSFGDSTGEFSYSV
ncbi:MAG TPA: DUF1552 domain-containing protein [Acidobacteriota bacterium]|nr:DUF1552 domain-containing protein [Acidobacteriota bacterium]